MTRADHIRAMTDEELASWIAALLYEQKVSIAATMERIGVGMNIIEVPMLEKAYHLKWLREPAPGEKENGG